MSTISARSYRAGLLLTLTFALAGSLASAQDTGREFHWTGKLAPESMVSIKNVNGSIQADLSPGDEVEVIAEKSGAHADDVKIQMVQLGDGIAFCAVYPGWFNDRCEESHSRGSHGDGPKVRFTVRLPENLRFAGESVNSDVIAENLGRFVRASSVNGKVRVSTKAWAEVSSVNGSLEARMGRADWPGTLKAETVNGSIVIELPSDASTDVNFESVNGHLRTEFPLTVRDSLNGHSVKGQIGSGGRMLKVETVNGSVELKRNSL